MALSLQVIEALAPDQGALAAAGKLRKPSQWLSLSFDQHSQTAWAECQGSGANPYRVIVDIDDHGYKCTCPSRKFPCKHSLALMWLYVETPERFVAGTPAEWVDEWQGRRRRRGNAPQDEAAATAPRASLAKVAGQAEDEVAAVDDAAARQRNAAAAAKRKAQTDAAIAQGLDDLQQWLLDQLQSGLAVFVEEAPARCRRIASRLVDAKAPTLASRLDEMPSRLLALPARLRLPAAQHELGQLHLLAQAWRAQPDDADARAGVVQAPTREAILADAGTRHVAGPWRVLGTEVETRRDGMVGQSTWLRHGHDGGRFALLQDFFPASAGRRSAAFDAGQRLDMTVSFHPGRHPLRGALNTAAIAAAASGEETAPPAPGGDLLRPHRHHLALVPWAQRTPLALGSGQVARDAEGGDWWLPEGGAAPLPLAALDEVAAWRGLRASSAVAVWNGWQATLLMLETALGEVYFHG